jgi:hypothetical protein
MLCVARGRPVYRQIANDQGIDRAPKLTLLFVFGFVIRMSVSPGFVRMDQIVRYSRKLILWKVHQAARLVFFNWMDQDKYGG